MRTCPSRFIVIAEGLAAPSGRAVADAFVCAMRIHGVPAEVLTDSSGRQFTGRFTPPRPAEVFFERVCRENGVSTKPTKPYSPTTTGKIEGTALCAVNCWTAAGPSSS